MTIITITPAQTLQLRQYREPKTCSQCYYCPDCQDMNNMPGKLPVDISDDETCGAFIGKKPFTVKFNEVKP